MELFKILSGIILLISGRKFFWFFVATAGFLVGMELTNAILLDQPQWIAFLVGLVVGLVGALLAIFVQHIAFALAGLYAGCYFGITLAHSLSLDRFSIFLLVLGGAVGTIMAALVMDWAIIVLSSLVGAGAILLGLDLTYPANTIVFLALAAGGILIQSYFVK